MMIRAYLFACSVLIASCSPPPVESPDLDLAESPETAEIFAENVVSTDLYERDIAISSDGNEVIYTLGDYRQNTRCLVSITKSAGVWQSPQIMPFSGRHQDIEPFLEPGDKRLYFASNRPIFGDSTRSDYNIWFTNRTEEGWSEPVALDTVINTPGDEFYPSVGKSGALYFTATRTDGIGREDIFIAQPANGGFLAPQPLDTTVNTVYFEFNAYVSPDENLLVFSSYGRDDGFGGGDLYYSVKDNSGKWGQSVNMGKRVNSDRLDYCPFIDWERENFYFTSDRTGKQPESLTSVQDIRKEANSIQNGFGNIYRINLSKLNIEK